MALTAVAFPIVPGKTDEWRAWMKEVSGPRHEEFVQSRRKAGLHERTFFQPTPNGDFVIVTLEGDDPLRSFGQMMQAKDPFTTWFVGRVKELHGVDLTEPMNGSPSQLVQDTE